MPIRIAANKKEEGLKPMIICDYDDCGEEITGADHGTCTWSENDGWKFYHADCYRKYRAYFDRSFPVMSGSVKSISIHEFLLRLLDNFKLSV